MTDKQNTPSIVKNVVDKFDNNRGLYEVVAELLGKHILPELFPDAQKVSARIKDPDSIAGKVLKKYIQLGDADKIYEKFTDFVGARVIFLRRDQVDAADARIRNFFTVDDHNSQNTAERLNDREFGYQSRHYIVRIDENWLNEKKNTPEANQENGEINAAIDNVISKIQGQSVFAELQVRTWLQHVWADLSHDSIYKGDRVIPRDLMRSWNALAAILENVDEDIVRCLDQLEQYRKNSAYNIAEEVDKKIEAMKIIAEVQLKLYLPNSLTKKERHHLTQSYDELLRLQKIKQGSDNELQNLIDNIGRAIKASTARKEDLTNPKELLEFLSKNEEKYADPILVPLLNMALERCENMIRSNSELPWAFAGKAFFNMLLFKEGMSDEEKKASAGKIYDSILRLIDLCNERSVANLDQERRIATPYSKDALKKLLEIFSKHSCFEDISLEAGRAPVWKCAKKMLELGDYAHISESSNSNNGEKEPAVIIAGGCVSLDNTTELYDFKRFFPAALNGNTEIHFYTGAGKQGICSLDFKKKQVTHFGCAVDTDAEVKSEYEKHSVWEALLTWDELRGKGYRFDDVALVGFGLGEISRWECRIALAFGARVTVIGHRDFLSYDRTFEGIPYWSNHPSLVRLPLIRNKEPENASFTTKNKNSILKFRSCGFPEPMMLRVFMLFKPYHQENYQKVDKDDVLRLIHRIKALKTTKSGKDFDDLDEDKKCSARHRLLSFENLYKDAHDGRAPNGKVKPPSTSIPCENDRQEVKNWLSEFKIKDASIDYGFGEREHARWYIERWLQGTRYGDNKIDKNVPSDRKRNPCMVAWFDLDDDTIVKDTDYIDRYLIAQYINKRASRTYENIVNWINEICRGRR